MRWLAIAARDLHSAVLLATEEPAASVFHSQQCAEKSSKALLALHDVPFRKTHDLTELGEQCAALEPTLMTLFKEAADLTDYATLFRYVDAPREPDAAEATAALATTRRVYEAVAARISQEPNSGNA